MQTDRTTRLASLIVAGTGVLWGLYWLPVRRLSEIGLPGVWGTFAIVAAAAFLLAPVALTRRRRALAGAHPLMLASLALGGAAFVLYSVGFLYGRIAIVALLFFLTPVWSTLIGRYALGTPVSALRLAAIVTGLAGLAIMLGADGRIPMPRQAGEWLGLISGILWSVATTGIRAAPPLAPVEAAFVFALGAVATALGLALVFSGWPVLPPGGLGPALGWAAGSGLLWWGVCMVALMWATARLEPARTGILLMAEVLVGALSGAVLAGERLGLLEIVGGALVLLAGILEVWPAPAPTPRSDFEKARR